MIGRFASTLLRLSLAAIAVAMLAAGASAGEKPLAITAIRTAGDKAQTRIVLEFDRAPAVRWFYLDHPHRLVVDLPDARLSAGGDALSGRGIVESARFGAMASDRTRLILTAASPFVVRDVREMTGEGGGALLSFDLAAASERAFDAALDERASITGSTRSTKSDRLGAKPLRDDGRHTVVIDPGHGGIDSGAVGTAGTLEKAVTLAFARDLAARLEKTGHYAVALTRNDDIFLPLDERVAIGRQHEADLFISLHADTISVKDMRGATVYTISEEASDALAAELADSENRADAAGGIIAGEAPADVADILLDLIRRETQAFSVVFARSLVGELDGRIELIRNPVRSAGFRVLRAPDVPSVLVELGYLSNPKDEALLNDTAWRARAVDGIVEAVGLFLDKPKAGVRG